MTNSECIGKYERYLTDEKKASRNTLSSYLRDIRQFGEYLDANGDADYVTASEADLNGYIDHLRQSGKSVATVSRNIASLKNFYVWMKLHGYVEANPTGKLVPDKAMHKLPEILTAEEVELLLSQPECTDRKGYRDREPVRRHHQLPGPGQGALHPPLSQGGEGPEGLCGLHPPGDDRHPWGAGAVRERERGTHEPPGLLEDR